MTRTVRTVAPETSVESLVTLMLEHNISAVPVVDADGKTAGIVTKTDLLRRYHDDAGTGEAFDTRIIEDGIEIDLDEGFHALVTGDASVSDIMTRRVLNVPEETAIGQAAAVMAFEGVHRLVVHSSEKKVVGILSTLDILRWLACDTGFVVPQVGRSRGPGS